MRLVNKLTMMLGLMAGIVLAGSSAVAQVSFSVPLIVTNSNGDSDTIYFGVDPAATRGIDDGTGGTTDLGEFEFPPSPPTEIFDIRWAGFPAGTNLGNGTQKHLRPYTGAAQADTFRVKFQAGGSTAFYPVTISWPSNMSQYFTTAVIKTTGATDVNMLTGTSIVQTDEGISTATIYTTGPLNPPTGVSVSPSTLNFGVVPYPTPGTATLPVTITNNGSSAAIVDSVVVSGSTAFAKAVTPTFPTNLAGTTSMNLDVVFTAPSAGSYAGTVSVYYNGGTTPATSTLSATASDGEGLYFLTDSNRVVDNTLGNKQYIGLKYSGTDSIQGLQFKLNVAAANLKLKKVEVGPSLATPGLWNFDYEISSATSGSDVTIVLYGQSNLVNLKTGTYDSLFVVTYDVKDLLLCDGATGGDSVQNIAWLSDVQSVLANNLGTPAGLTADPVRDTAYYFIYNSSSRGDVNCDDRVNVLDILDIVDVTLGRSAFAPWQTNRADLAPWSSLWATNPIFSDATNYGDTKVNVQDVVLVGNAILNENWPDTDPLWKSYGGNEESGNEQKGGASTQAAYDVKFQYVIDNHGVDVNINNLVPVKGIQMKLKADMAPADIDVLISEGISSRFDVQKKVANGEIRLLFYSLAGDAIPPTNDRMFSLPFTIANPKLISVIEPITVGGADNKGLKVEYEVAYRTSGTGDVDAVRHFALATTPNPTTGAAAISYMLPNATDVTVVVTDANGREVARLVENTRQNAGHHAIRFDTEGLANGNYFLTLMADGMKATRTIILAR